MVYLITPVAAVKAPAIVAAKPFAQIVAGPVIAIAPALVTSPAVLAIPLPTRLAEVLLVKAIVPSSIAANGTGRSLAHKLAVDNKAIARKGANLLVEINIGFIRNSFPE
jgi:hypothetical protein